MLLTAAECGVDCPGPAAQQVVGPARCARAALRARGHDGNDALSALLRLHHAISSNAARPLTSADCVRDHVPLSEGPRQLHLRLNGRVHCALRDGAHCVQHAHVEPHDGGMLLIGNDAVTDGSLLITTVLCSGLFVNVLPALLGAGNFVGEPVSPLTQLLRSLTKLRVALDSGSSRCCATQASSPPTLSLLSALILLFYSSGTATILQC